MRLGDTVTYEIRTEGNAPVLIFHTEARARSRAAFLTKQHKSRVRIVRVTHAAEDIT